MTHKRVSSTETSTLLNSISAQLADFVKEKTGRKLPLSAARELLAIARKSPSWNHLLAQSKDVVPPKGEPAITTQKGFECRVIALVNSDHVTEEVSQGEVFRGTDSEWRLYSNENTSATYYLGDDIELFKEEVAPLLTEHDASVFVALMNKGFVEVRFDEEAPITSELPMRPGLLDTENSKSSSVSTKSNLYVENNASTKEVLLYGCHCELDEGQTPDACVIDLGRVSGCALALANRDNPNWKNKCPHWMPITLPQVEAARVGLYGCKCNLENEHDPDACVIDTGNPGLCKKAASILQRGVAQNTCEDWVPVSVLFPNRHENPSA